MRAGPHRNTTHLFEGPANSMPGPFFRACVANGQVGCIGRCPLLAFGPDAPAFLTAHTLDSDQGQSRCVAAQRRGRSPVSSMPGGCLRVLGCSDNLAIAARQSKWLGSRHEEAGHAAHIQRRETPNRAILAAPLCGWAKVAPDSVENARKCPALPCAFRLVRNDFGLQRSQTLNCHYSLVRAGQSSIKPSGRGGDTRRRSHAGSKTS
jgi:hypothetical protein